LKNGEQEGKTVPIWELVAVEGEDIKSVETTPEWGRRNKRE
jgi:hypothetical protein